MPKGDVVPGPGIIPPGYRTGNTDTGGGDLVDKAKAMHAEVQKEHLAVYAITSETDLVKKTTN